MCLLQQEVGKVLCMPRIWEVPVLLESTPFVSPNSIQIVKSWNEIFLFIALGILQEVLSTAQKH